jgi:hypothetical protein
MNYTKRNSYNYKGTTYSMNPIQEEVLEKVRSLPRKHLHYVVGQQGYDRPNLTLKELKKSIRRGLVNYQRTLDYRFNPKTDNPLVKCFCVFETDKDFHLTQMNDVVEQNFNLGLHFHLFITTSDDYHWVCFPSLAHHLFEEISSYSTKRNCISKYDYVRVSELTDPFILYHTKQLHRIPSREMILMC